MCVQLSDIFQVEQLPRADCNKMSIHLSTFVLCFLLPRQICQWYNSLILFPYRTLSPQCILFIAIIFKKKKKQPLFHIIVINNVLVSGEQQSYSVTHIYFFKFFPI